MDSDSLPDAFHLDSSSDRLSSLNTTMSTLDSAKSIDETSVDMLNASVDMLNEESMESAENLIVFESRNESDVNDPPRDVNVDDDAEVVREEAPAVAQEPIPFVRMTRSRLRRKQAESGDADNVTLSSATETETDADDNVAIFVERDSAATEEKPTSKKATPVGTDEAQEVERELHEKSDDRVEMASPMRRCKRKRNIKGNLDASFQAPSLKRLTHHSHKA
jgi:hypothetical protein